MRRLRTRWPVLLLGATALLLGTAVVFPQRADAQIRRCTAADGNVIYTDRTCADVQAVESRPDAAAAGQQGQKIVARGCSRNVRDLIFEVTAAIDSHDVNRLAGVYYWTGMSTRGGYALMGRLEAISNRPLLQVSAILPAPQITVRADGSTTVRGDVDASGYAQANVRRAPIGLRIEQTYPDTIRSARTNFGLRHAMGCWFLTF